jgi:hypothetical protein
LRDSLKGPGPIATLGGKARRSAIEHLLSAKKEVVVQEYIGEGIALGKFFKAFKA